VDQRRGLQCLRTAFANQFRKGQFPKFFAGERQQLVPSREVTLFHLRQDLCHDLAGHPSHASHLDMVSLRAHAQHTGVFSEQELTRFVGATAPASQLASQERHKIMKKSRSKKTSHSPEPARNSIAQSQSLSGLLFSKSIVMSQS